MKNYILMLLSVCTSGLVAQEHYIGVKGTLGLTKITELIVENSFLTRPSFGVTYDYQLNPKIMLSAEALISNRGLRNKIIETNVNAQPIRIVFVDERFSYFAIPIKFSYIIQQESNLMLRIGLSPSFLIGSETVVKGSDSPTYNTIYNGLNLSDFGMLGLLEVGINLKAFDNSAIYTTLGAFYGLGKVYNNIPSQHNGPNHFGYEASIGYKRRL